MRLGGDGGGLGLGAPRAARAAGRGRGRGRRAGASSARAARAAGRRSATARPGRSARRAATPLGQRSRNSQARANSQSGWRTCERIGTGRTTSTPMKMPMPPNMRVSRPTRMALQRHEHEGGRQRQAAELHDDLARDEADGVARVAHGVDGPAPVQEVRDVAAGREGREDRADEGEHAADERRVQADAQEAVVARAGGEGEVGEREAGGERGQAEQDGADDHRAQVVVEELELRDAQARGRPDGARDAPRCAGRPRTADAARPRAPTSCRRRRRTPARRPGRRPRRHEDADAPPRRAAGLRWPRSLGPNSRGTMAAWKASASSTTRTCSAASRR